ncbi:MAG: glycosyl hydrolase [Helicobacteraceae bacterium]|jgi:beta-N-acetylhexosaminidase|nr:glycosyl hydrolase [Helicobacteraceae bacterium]
MRKILYLLLALCSAAGAEVPLEKMIGQMIAVGFDGSSSSHEWIKLIKKQIRNGEVGAVVMYAKNIVDPRQLQQLAASMHTQGSPLPIWVMVDQEGGKIERLPASKGFAGFPSAAKVARGSVANAFGVYRNMACELRGYAINFNLAPVVDLDVNNSVISSQSRAFSKKPEAVAKYADAFIRAHNSCGVLTALKHFPGYGSTVNDTHFESADTTALYDKQEMEPYRLLLNRAHAVMVSHMVDRNVDDLPASLSKKQIDLLRTIGFGGVVMTDDLQMAAIASNFDLNETVIRAINAGNDMLLFSNMLASDREIPYKVRRIILEAVKNKEISADRIKASYGRIAALKRKRLG